MASLKDFDYENEGQLTAYQKWANIQLQLISDTYNQANNMNIEELYEALKVINYLTFTPYVDLDLPDNKMEFFENQYGNKVMSTGNGSKKVFDGNQKRALEAVKAYSETYNKAHPELFEEGKAL